MWHRIEDSGTVKKRQSNESQQLPRAARNLINPVGSSVTVPKEASGTDDNTAGFIQYKSNTSRYAHGFYIKIYTFRLFLWILKYITQLT